MLTPKQTTAVALLMLESLGCSHPEYMERFPKQSPSRRQRANKQKRKQVRAARRHNR